MFAIGTIWVEDVSRLSILFPITVKISFYAYPMYIYLTLKNILIADYSA